MTVQIPKGKMIVIEGIEGAGKSSAIGTVELFLQQRNISYVALREPGGTNVGEKLRAILKDKQVCLHPVTELLLMYASRNELFNTVILPSLTKGQWVISDRFELSSYAYQGAGRQIPEQVISAISGCCLGDFQPDLTLYLDVGYQVSQARLHLRGIAKDRIEQEDEAFFNRIRQAYCQKAKVIDSIKQVDASQSLEIVTAEIIKELSLLC